MRFSYIGCVHYREFEESLCRLPTIDAVRVVGSNGTVREVHVLATPGKPAKQIVRDVQSLAMARFGLTIDRRVVSVVQIESEETSGGDRPAVVDITTEPDGARSTVTLTLSWKDEIFTGTANGPAATATKLRIVGDATIAALEKVIGEEHALALAALEAPIVGGKTVAIAQIVIVSGGEERMVVGSAIVGSDPSIAAARAVLDAVNRLVPQLRR